MRTASRWKPVFFSHGLAWDENSKYLGMILSTLWFPTRIWLGFCFSWIGTGILKSRKFGFLVSKRFFQWKPRTASEQKYSFCYINCLDLEFRPNTSSIRQNLTSFVYFEIVLSDLRRPARNTSWSSTSPYFCRLAGTSRYEKRFSDNELPKNRFSLLVWRPRSLTIFFTKPEEYQKVRLTICLPNVAILIVRWRCCRKINRVWCHSRYSNEIRVESESNLTRIEIQEKNGNLEIPTNG